MTILTIILSGMLIVNELAALAMRSFAVYDVRTVQSHADLPAMLIAQWVWASAVEVLATLVAILAILSAAGDFATADSTLDSANKIRVT